MCFFHDYVLPEFTFQILIHKVSIDMDDCFLNFFIWYFWWWGIFRMRLFQIYLAVVAFISSLAPCGFEWKSIFKLMLVIDSWGISYKIFLIWMPLNSTDDKSTLVQVMAWCRQATSHYLSKCWSRSMLLRSSLAPNELTPETTKG